MEPREDDKLHELEAQVAAMIARETGPIAAARAWSRPRRFALLGLVGGIGVAFLYIFLRRDDFADYPSGRYLAIAASYAFVGLTALWSALRPLHRPPLPAWFVSVVLVVGVLVPLVVALLPELPTLGRFEHASPEKHVGWAAYCWAVGGVTGLLVYLPLLLVDRSGLRQVDRALLAGVAGGMAGVAAVHMECAINYPLHLLVGHVAIPMIFLGISYARYRMSQLA
jgi:hypothetical protein